MGRHALHLYMLQFKSVFSTHLLLIFVLSSFVVELLGIYHTKQNWTCHWKWQTVMYDENWCQENQLFHRIWFSDYKVYGFFIRKMATAAEMHNGLTLTFQNGISSGHKYRFTSSLVTGNWPVCIFFSIDLIWTQARSIKAMPSLDCLFKWLS